MDMIKGYLDNISEAAKNDGNAYFLLTDNMSNIVANNTTRTSTVATTQKNRMFRDQIKSLEDKLAVATCMTAPITTKTYTSPGPGTGNPQKWVKVGYCWEHGYGV